MKKTMIALACLVAVTFTSCFTMVHTVGEGAKTGVSVEQKQWYALWGLVPINEVDTKAMSGGVENYTITTQQSFVDQLISAITGAVSIVVQTVEVQK